MAVYAQQVKPLNIVTTLPDYAWITKQIGKKNVHVQSIVLGNQDAHFIRPKPSFVSMVRSADMLVATGLDLELWLPTVVDKSGNQRIRSGEKGYVAAAQGMHLLEKPAVMSRAEGGVHIYGNPHVTCSPVNMRIAARNVAEGLIKNDPDHKTIYRENLDIFLNDLYSRLFGSKLVDAIGGEALCAMVENGTLYNFLNEQKLNGKPLLSYLEGWLKKMEPLRGKPIVTYHKNWVYFLKLFGLEEAGAIEPKPGIPPSPHHVQSLITMMKERKVGIVLAANYFDRQKVNTVAAKVHATPVVVPLYVEGEKGIESYFALVDLWVMRLTDAQKNAKE
jgi:ABC-type Zn uptake system ZnuABC Zn-binding protein ZnuA